MTPGTGRTGDRPHPRTLADELRARTDEELTWLLRARPDLLSPLPADLSQLATRAGTRASVLRALERLDTFTLQTAEALGVAPQPCPYPDALAALLPGPECAARLPHAMDTLRRHALVWGPREAPRLVRTARELLAPTPERPSATGLGPTLGEAAGRLSPSRMQALLAAAGLPSTHDPVSAVAALTELFGDRKRMTALLDQAPERSLAVLHRLVWGPPYGAVPARPGPPLQWLLDRGLLLPHAPGTVVLPREVALHLRGLTGGGAHREPLPLPPELTTRVRPAGAGSDLALATDVAAGTTAYTALTVVDTLLTAWETDGPPVLRAGGLGVRELKRTAVALDVAEPEATFWIELAYGAGLLASDGEADERYAPTPRYDEWLAEPPQRRWVRLASSWLAATRVPGLVGSRDAKGRLHATLGPGLDRGPTVELRHRVLALLAELPPGEAPEPGAIAARIAWELPRRMPEDLRDQLTAATLAEAEQLGVTGHGALASFARALLPPATSDTDAEADADRRTDHPTKAPALPDGDDPFPDHRRTGPPAGGRGRADGGLGAGDVVPGDPERQPGSGATTEASGAAGPAGAPGRADEATRQDSVPGDPEVPPGSDPTEASGAGTRSRADEATGQESVPGHPVGRPDPAAAEALDAPGQAGGAAGGSAGSGPAGPGAAQAPAGAGRPASAPGRDTPESREAECARLLAERLPALLDHFLLQADLTAVAPGPLERELAQAMAVVAEVESTGGATVFRFTPFSVRRALDAGWSPAELHAFLAKRSRTPVPQPLTYLVDDVARKHGRMRVGAAASYLRCDDEATLTQLLADRRAEALRLRRLAPTVLVSDVSPDTLLDRLREMGLAPAAETAEGAVLTLSLASHRTPPRSAPHPAPELSGDDADDALLSAAVRALRAGDHAAPGPDGAAGAATPRLPEPEGGAPPRTSTAETLAVLQDAVRSGDPVWIGYVGADGIAGQRVLSPVRVEGGFVTGFDHTAEEVRTYPLHRITGTHQLAR
ncbi:helicase-associated domain-containing protein [Streptomyces sp. B6B3]|uniref:helicase-associated domain-containing protein n=1 Tax=Streptomyces sp. B6B3 TaxID=3153570 RepID=UPI00325D6D71